MKKVIVKNNAGLEVGFVQLKEPQSWIDQCIASNVWGKPERWVPASESHDPADVIAREVREVSPAMAAVIDDKGHEVSPAVAAKQTEWVKLRAEYTVEIVDITYETQLAECMAKRKAEYTSAEEFLDVFFDGDAAKMAGIKALRQAIKTKYPKPVRS